MSQLQQRGDATDFGDLTVARRNLAGCTNRIRGTFAGWPPAIKWRWEIM